MNLINKKVTHKHFGAGSIVKQNDSIIDKWQRTMSNSFLDNLRKPNKPT